jgi:hypothetical protein
VDELRATIAGAAGFRQVAPLLAALSAAQCREIAPALERWSDASREAPQAWLDAAEPPAALSLCRAVSLVERRVEGEVLARLLAHPALAGITRLALGMSARGLKRETLGRLAALRELTIVTHDPYTSAVDDDDVAEIAGAPLALERLAFDMVRLRGPGVAALARSQRMENLRELELFTPATAAVCAGLAGPGLRGLRRLALCADGFTEASARALARAEFVAGLRVFELRVAESGGFDWSRTFSASAPEGARNARQLALALARLLPGLRACEHVSVEYCPERQVVKIGKEEFARLAGDPRALREALPRALRRQ